MQITHEQAHQYIQYAFDGEIDFRQRQLLDAHLASCAACQSYAKSMESMESILRPLLQRQWSRQPIPLSIGALTFSAHSKTTDSMILAIRIAAISVMLFAFMISVWQISSSRLNPQPLPASVPQIPVPSTSTQLISTTSQTEACLQTVHIVQVGETLNSLAAKFQIRSAALLSANQIKANDIRAGMKLIIPDCNYTPTVNALTTTFTPVVNQITSTPGG